MFWVFGLSPKERTRLAIMILRDKLDKAFQWHNKPINSDAKKRGAGYR